jgi:hypothetical protein
MKTLLLLPDFITCPDIWDIISLLLAVFALLLAFGFKLRPRIKGEFYFEANKIKVRLYNINRFNRLITNIKCEMSLSTDESFNGNVDTLILEKDWIVCLSKGSKNNDRNYVFKQKDTGFDKGKKYLRVRFLISNFLGISKAYEEIISLDKIINPPLARIIGKPN